MPNVPTFPGEEWEGEDIFSAYGCLPADLPHTLPEGLIPDHHQEPTWDDPDAPRIDLASLFTTGQALSGLSGQAVNRDLSAIAEQIASNFSLAAIADRLAVYRKPCWEILDPNTGNDFIAEQVRRFFPDDVKYLNRRHHAEILFQLLHHPNTERLSHVPAPDYQYLCCQDAVYDWKTGAVLSHASDFYRFSVLNLRAKEIGCGDGEQWEMFLDNLTGGDNALRQRVLEIIGVIITGYPSKSFFLLEGEGDTGKSQLANFLRALLGTDCCVALNDISQLGDRWTTGTLSGKLLCICGDVPDAPLTNKAIGTIKQLTGDDLIRGEEKYRSPFMFENTAKLLFISNHPLQISSAMQDDALINRLVSIPCRYPVPKSKRIEGLYQLLLKENGYIVGLALDALVKFDARNGIFTPLPDDLSEAIVPSLPGSFQVVADFVRDCCILDEAQMCPVADAFAAFAKYAPSYVLDNAQFSKTIYAVFPQIRPKRTNTQRYFKGLGLL